jgi:hypothetical protein
MSIFQPHKRTLSLSGNGTWFVTLGHLVAAALGTQTSQRDGAAQMTKQAEHKAEDRKNWGSGFGK